MDNGSLLFWNFKIQFQVSLKSQLIFEQDLFCIIIMQFFCCFFFFWFVFCFCCFFSFLVMVVVVGGGGGRYKTSCGWGW